MAIVKADILSAVRQFGVQTVRLQFVDILGGTKGVDIPATRLERALDHELSFDGSSLFGFARTEEADVKLRPDYNTFAVLPWHDPHGRAARLICDVCAPDGRPFPHDPRQALRRVERRLEALGFRVETAPECEFYLFAGPPRLGPLRPHDGAGYFDMGPSDLGERTRREIVIALEAIGFSVEASHHEVGPGQHEIRLNGDAALTIADRVATLKLVARRLAREADLAATFMPKPLFDRPGSGMHTDWALFDRDNRNAFADPQRPSGLSETARHFVAGILAHARALCALTNPLVNSYKRLLPGFEAPYRIAWSTASRQALVRVPPERGRNTRLELRSPDPACNPYLAFAAILAAGLDGLARRLEPPLPLEERSAAPAQLPVDLGEALDALAADRVLIDALGGAIAETYLQAKSIEWGVYLGQVHPWEIEQYFDSF
ncbi:MAG TPA: glutamine synthetase family protein [Limnochordia bacterium]|nr:glutamine synthetase family protein [Limnochordia bacterium]